MFSNSGEKIKTVAKVAFCIESLIDIFIFIYLIGVSDDSRFQSSGTGFVLFIILILFIGAAYVLNLFLYGFGDLISNTEYMASKASTINCAKPNAYSAPAAIKPANNPPPVHHPVGSEWICNNCGDKNPSNTNICKGCGKYR